MKFTLSWLKEFLETEATLEQISETLTSIGLEVEEITNLSEKLQDFTVAEILETQPHPNADKLQICKVNVGSETQSIVCGAPNARTGIKVPYAKIGTVIPANGMKIKKSKIRDVESCGMLCSAAELELSEDSEGIFELPENSTVGQPFAKFIDMDDVVIEIAITPNRGDCLGVYGIARDLAAAGLGKLKDPEIPTHKGTYQSPIALEVQENSSCKWFQGVYLKNIQNKPTPDWLKTKLELIGQKSISALVDITNYCNITFGRPSHIYDADKISNKLTARLAKQGEKITALDEKEYELDDTITVISDEKAPQAIAGLIGGMESSCTLETKNTFLEVAWFDPIKTAYSIRNLQINTDSSYRFERTVDPESYKYTALLAKMITDICGGEPSEIIIAGNLEYQNKEIDFDYSLVKQMTTMEFGNSEINEVLTNLGFQVQESGNKAKITVPSWRPDVEIPQDIVEEIARIKGYDNVPVIRLEKPQSSVKALNPTEKKLRAACRLLASNGLKEAVTYSFMKQENAEKFLSANHSLIELANPISSDFGVMRPSIIPNLLEAVKNNRARTSEQISLFELGGTFAKDENQNFQQNQSLAAIKCGMKSQKSPLNEKEEEFSVFDIKQNLFDILGLYIDAEKIKIQDNGKFSYYHPGRSGTINLGKNTIAVFGEIHPAILKNYDLEEKVVAFEIFTDSLPQQKEKKSFTAKPLEISNYQAIERDFAFVLDKKIPAQEIISAVKASDKNLIKEATIFDIYQGKNIDEGKKSVAVRITAQSSSETLTDEQIEELSQKVIGKLNKDLGASLRA
jgi:phenylalanyl-tRNA synthetase beta chain